MKKLFALLLVLTMVCSLAMADTFTVGEDQTTVVCVLNGQDWECIIEDENVLSVSDTSYDEAEDVTTITLAGENPGTTSVEMYNDVDTAAVTVFVNEALYVEIVNEYEVEAYYENNLLDIELTESETVLVVTLNGSEWGAVIENTDIVTEMDNTYNEEDDTTVISFLGGNPGVSEIVFSNGMEAELLTVFVNEAGYLSLIDPTESVENQSFYYAAEISIAEDNPAALVVRVDGNWNVAIDNTAVIDFATFEYDEEQDMWIGSFLAGENGATDIYFTNDTATGIIGVQVYNGEIVDFWDDCEDMESWYSFLNPNHYEYMNVTDVFTMDDGTTVLQGTLGNIKYEEGADDDYVTEGFDEDETMAFVLAEGATVSMPAEIDTPSDNVACEDLSAYVSACHEEYPEYEFTARIEMNEDAEITAVEYIYLP